MTLYKAKARGFIGRPVEKGETFKFAGPKGSWMEEVELEKPVQTEPQKTFVRARKSKAVEE